MIKVKKTQMNMIEPLFKWFADAGDATVISCLQGYMGDVYIAVPEHPKAGLLLSGEYCFFGGNSDSDEAEYLIKKLFSVVQGEEIVAYFPENLPEWEAKLLSCPENNPVAVPRFAIVQRDYEFDERILQKYIDAIPKEYAFAPFNENLYHQAMQESWSKEFCETFESADDYLKRGFGFAILDNGKLVSGASTMNVYDGGAEIQIATHEDYKQKGLAISCAALFIRECMKRKIRPHWDAANLISKKIALNLGYEYKGEFITIHMRRKGGNHVQFDS